MSEEEEKKEEQEKRGGGEAEWTVEKEQEGEIDGDGDGEGEKMWPVINEQTEGNRKYREEREEEQMKNRVKEEVKKAGGWQWEYRRWKCIKNMSDTIIWC